MEQKSSTADRVSKRLPDAYSCQPEGLRQTQKKKKKREPWIFGSVSGTFPMTSQQPWSPLDRDRKGKPIVPTLLDECRVRAICTCCIFRHTTNIRNERGSFRDSLVSGDLNGYRYLCEFTHSAALRPIVRSKEDLFERILLDFPFLEIGIIFGMQYCNIPRVFCRKSFQNSFDDYSAAKETDKHWFV